MKRALGLAFVLVALASGCARSAIATSTGASVTTLRSASLAAPVRTAFVGEGSLEAHGETTGQTKLPALQLPDGRVIVHSRAIRAWIGSEGVIGRERV